MLADKIEEEEDRQAILGKDIVNPTTGLNLVDYLEGREGLHNEALLKRYGLAGDGDDVYLDSEVGATPGGAWVGMECVHADTWGRMGACMEAHGGWAHGGRAWRCAWGHTGACMGLCMPGYADTCNGAAAAATNTTDRPPPRPAAAGAART